MLLPTSPADSKSGYYCYILYKKNKRYKYRSKTRFFNDRDVTICNNCTTSLPLLDDFVTNVRNITRNTHKIPSGKKAGFFIPNPVLP